MRRAGVIAVAGLVAACVAKQPPPQVFTDYAVAVGTARLLASGCPSVSLDGEEMGEGAQELGRALATEGFSPQEINDFQFTLDTSGIEAANRRYVAENGLSTGDPDAFCQAAEREFSTDSPAARYLDRV